MQKQTFSNSPFFHGKLTFIEKDKLNEILNNIEINSNLFES